MKRIRYLTLLWMLLCGIIAKAQFDPANPAEPGQLTSKLVLNVSPLGAGSTSGGGDIIPGTSVTVNAYANTVGSLSSGLTAAIQRFQPTLHTLLRKLLKQKH